MHELGVKVRKPFEKMTKEDLQTFLHSESNPHKNSKGKPFDGNKEGTIALYKQHIKQFYESIVAQHLKQQTPTQQTA